MMALPRISSISAVALALIFAASPLASAGNLNQTHENYFAENPYVYIEQGGYCGVLTKVDGNPHSVSFDRYSLLIDGEREFIASGEFNLYRCPSVEQWRDRLEKIKASGFNCVDLYISWAYHCTAEGVYDFSGNRDVDILLRICEDLGLYVLFRPGPYVCSEVHAGGLPGWLLGKGADVLLRCQLPTGLSPVGVYSPAYVQYCMDWFDQILSIARPHLITNGGSIVCVQIENEYNQATGNRQYMQELYDGCRQRGINVPIFTNEWVYAEIGMPLGDWSDLADIYASDLYPAQDASKPWDTSTFSVLDTLESNQRPYATDSPLFITELQGGWYDGWGGVGYDHWRTIFNGDYFNIVDKSIVGQGFTMFNHYVFYGGTTWGYWGDPNVYTSYDYATAIRESGGLSDVYYAMKRNAMTIDAFKDGLAKTDVADTVTATNSTVLYKARQGDNGIFTFLRNADNGSALYTKLTMPSGWKNITIPAQGNISVPQRSMKIVVSNYDAGDFKVSYCTSDILTMKKIGGKWVMIVYGDQGMEGELLLDIKESPQISGDVQNVQYEWNEAADDLRLNFKHAERSIVNIDGGNVDIVIVITTESDADQFWVTETEEGPWIIGGPYLVRGISSSGEINFDVDETANLLVFSPNVEKPEAEGKNVHELADIGACIIGNFNSSAPKELPVLTDWKYRVSPELEGASEIQSKTIGIGEPMDMFSNGYYYGHAIYSGTFAQTIPGLSGLALEIDARTSYSVYVNGVHIGSHTSYQENPATGFELDAPDQQVFQIPADALGDTNTIIIIAENLGANQNFGFFADAKFFRGVRSATLIGASAPLISWEISGGLYGENLDWDEPGFDDSNWQDVSLPYVPQNQSAVGWYRTEFELNLSQGSDQPIGLVLESAHSKATIYLNGVLIGRYWNEKGPQHKFYLPEGILNTNGRNTLAIAVWNMGEDGAIGKVSLEGFNYSYSTHYSLSMNAEEEKLIMMQPAIMAGVLAAMALALIAAYVLVKRGK
ncbi:MAG: beta-galactosidase [Candidatus Thermoplasmatota archaeon]|nr:beta-galactosidase [Candidatus Thermoplasmatota archaeon]